ncbi:WbqC family protein [Bergeyella sp. RCAD1439]|uniref:WbqC family protein n=1 Tax=Bergeyella anatis TaxID=3113737 RepID=UPI002E17EA5D|nr:WbqC family protein [Bergeyella sp. RCAD1439]
MSLELSGHRLMPVFYMPPVSWFSFFLEQGSEITLEQYEHFPKQTYRNRANIYGANGRLSLIIPIRHTGARVMNSIEISYAENWRGLHWKSIKTAYQSSPYFEFYESRLAEIFKLEERYLLEYNLKALAILLDLLKEAKPYTLSEEYLGTPKGADLRMAFSAKQASEYPMEAYYQTFSDKYGFIGDLSVIDLLCNKGPESSGYIRNLETKLL